MFSLVTVDKVKSSWVEEKGKKQVAIHGLSSEVLGRNMHLLRPAKALRVQHVGTEGSFNNFLRRDVLSGVLVPGGTPYGRA